MKSIFWCKAHTDSVVRYFIWYTNDSSGVLLKQDKLLSWESLAKCEEYIASMGLEFDPDCDGDQFDFGALQKWFENYRYEPIEPVLLLDLWNLLEDYLISIGVDDPNQPREYARVYNKLFYASNLPSVTPPGESFDPVWSTEDRNEIVAALEQPFGDFCRDLGIAEERSGERRC